MPGLLPWHMGGFTFEELAKIDAALKAAREAQQDAGRISGQFR